MSWRAYRCSAKVGADGKLALQVPLAAGTPVEVLVLVPDAEDCADLIGAARSSTDFWDNPLDDADWNNV